MSNLVKRLRTYFTDNYKGPPMASDQLAHEAADEIERLTRELAMATDAANKGEKARLEATGMMGRIEQLEGALQEVVESIYCHDGYRGVGISEEAERAARQALKEQNDE